MLFTEYPVISTGSIYTTIDSYNTSLENNGALNPLGATYKLPLNPAGYTGTAPLAGLGAPLFIKYVQYNNAAATTDNFISAPGVVYWVDKSYTVVDGNANNSYSTNANAVAGYIALNTTNYPGNQTGAQLLTLVKNNFVWIVVGGYLPGARSAASIAAGDWLIGSTASAFVPARIAAGSNLTNNLLGTAATAVSSNLSDVLVGPPSVYV